MPDRQRQPDRRVEERVRGYIHHLLDAAYIRSTFLRDERRAARTIAAMLASGEPDRTNAAMLFVEDAIVRGLPEAQGGRVRAMTLPNLRALLLAPDQNLRWNAVVTLGRIGPASGARDLDAAFPFYLERDPPALPRLLQGLAQLRAEHFAWERVEEVLASPFHLARWSLMDVIEAADTTRGSRSARRVVAVRARLAADEHPLVRAEARGEAELGFFSLRARFTNYLHTTGRRDYDVETLDAFALYQHQHAPPRPFDRAADARAFEAWRTRSDATP